MTNYVGSIWHTRVPTEGTPEWEMYVANTDNSIIMPIQFADENAVVTFLAVLHDVWNYGLVEGY